MNCSVEKASRKWANGAIGRIGAAMVTVAAALVLLGPPLSEPAAAARWTRPAPWGDLFGPGPKRPRAAVRRVAVPLPKPRPADAPVAAPEPPAADKQGPAEPPKPTEQAAAPAVPQPSACRLALTD